jgi:hypothetical protein
MTPLGDGHDVTDNGPRFGGRPKLSKALAGARIWRGTGVSGRLCDGAGGGRCDEHEACEREGCN